MNDIISKMADRSFKNNGDYRDEQGFLLCSKCHTRKECELEFPKGSGQKRKFPIMCKCEEDAELKYKQQQERLRHLERMKALYTKGLTDEAYHKNTFDRDDNRNVELTTLCKKYVKNWKFRMGAS